MKKIILSIILAVATLTVTAQIKVEVSETVELMSILARTAGYEEYSNDTPTTSPGSTPRIPRHGSPPTRSIPP